MVTNSTSYRLAWGASLGSKETVGSAGGGGTLGSAIKHECLLRFLQLVHLTNVESLPPSMVQARAAGRQAIAVARPYAHTPIPRGCYTIATEHIYYEHGNLLGA